MIRIRKFDILAMISTLSVISGQVHINIPGIGHVGVDEDGNTDISMPFVDVTTDENGVTVDTPFTDKIDIDYGTSYYFSLESWVWVDDDEDYDDDDYYDDDDDDYYDDDDDDDYDRRSTTGIESSKLTPTSRKSKNKSKQGGINVQIPGVGHVDVGTGNVDVNVPFFEMSLNYDSSWNYDYDYDSSFDLWPHHDVSWDYEYDGSWNFWPDYSWDFDYEDNYGDYDFSWQYRDIDVSQKKKMQKELKKQKPMNKSKATSKEIIGSDSNNNRKLDVVVDVPDITHIEVPTTSSKHKESSRRKRNDREEGFHIDIPGITTIDGVGFDEKDIKKMRKEQKEQFEEMSNDQKKRYNRYKKYRDRLFRKRNKRLRGNSN